MFLADPQYNPHRQVTLKGGKKGGVTAQAVVVHVLSNLHHYPAGQLLSGDNLILKMGKSSSHRDYSFRTGVGILRLIPHPELLPRTLFVNLLVFELSDIKQEFIFFNRLCLVEVGIQEHYTFRI